MKSIPIQYQNQNLLSNSSFDQEEEVESATLCRIYKECASKSIGITKEIPLQHIFILWGCCYIDLRVSKDLNEDKVAVWNNFTRVDQVLLIENTSLSVRTTQNAIPLTDFSPILRILKSYSSMDFKRLHDFLIIYEKAAAMRVQQIARIKAGEETAEHLSAAIQQRYEDFQRLAKEVIRLKNTEGYPMAVITTAIDFNKETMVLEGTHYNPDFLQFMGINPVEYAEILLRKGGLEYLSITDSIRLQIMLLQNILTKGDSSPIQLEVVVKTFDNFDVPATLNGEFVCLPDTSSKYFGDRFLFIQQFKVHHNAATQLRSQRESHLKRSLRAGYQDEIYLHSCQDFLTKYYSTPTKILKKFKRPHQ